MNPLNCLDEDIVDLPIHTSLAGNTLESDEGEENICGPMCVRDGSNDLSNFSLSEISDLPQFSPSELDTLASKPKYLNPNSSSIPSSLKSFHECPFRVIRDLVINLPMLDEHSNSPICNSIDFESDSSFLRYLNENEIAGEPLLFENPNLFFENSKNDNENENRFASQAACISQTNASCLIWDCTISNMEAISECFQDEITYPNLLELYEKAEEASSISVLPSNYTITSFQNDFKVLNLPLGLVDTPMLESMQVINNHAVMKVDKDLANECISRNSCKLSEKNLKQSGSGIDQAISPMLHLELDSKIYNDINDEKVVSPIKVHFHSFDKTNDGTPKYFQESFIELTRNTRKIHCIKGKYSSLQQQEEESGLIQNKSFSKKPFIFGSSQKRLVDESKRPWKPRLTIPRPFTFHTTLGHSRSGSGV